MRNKIQFTLIENSTDFTLVQMLNQYTNVNVNGNTGKARYRFNYHLPCKSDKNSFESMVVSKLSGMDKGINFMLKTTAKLIYVGNGCMEQDSGCTYSLYFEEL